MTDVAAIQDEAQEVPAEVNKLRWTSLRKRRGHFTISAVTMVDSLTLVEAVMRECTVTRCEHRFDTDAFDYSAMSWCFREVDEGHVTPEYSWAWDEDGNPHATETKT